MDPNDPPTSYLSVPVNYIAHTLTGGYDLTQDIASGLADIQLEESFLSIAMSESSSGINLDETTKIGLGALTLRHALIKLARTKPALPAHILMVCEDSRHISSLQY